MIRTILLALNIVFVSTWDSGCSPKVAPATSSSAGRKSIGLDDGVPKELATKGTHGTQSDTALSPQDLSAQYLALEASIKKRNPILEREEERRKNLMLSLMANIGAGCMGEVTINTVEVIIDGEKLVDNDVTTLKQNDQYLPQPVAGKTNFIFYIGDTGKKNFITFTNNEQQTPLFATGSHFTYTVPQSQQIKINLVDTVSIKKEAPAYSTDDFCKDYKGKAIEGCTQQKTIKELERYEINNFTIKVNGNTLYTKSNINHVFAVNPGSESDVKSQAILWQDFNTQLNNAYVKLLQTANCPGQ